jgi:site-specific DNA-methyltransferase (adenine-specific)
MYRRAVAVPVQQPPEVFTYGRQRLYNDDCLNWLKTARKNSISAVITDPPYGLIEYSPEQQKKMRSRSGGVWRIPPTFDGANRKALPRFTVLTGTDRTNLSAFFEAWASALLPALKPGAHVAIAGTPLLAPLVAVAMEVAGFERRGEIVRLVRTFRGGDRPKGAESEFSSVSTMPRSCWEPWGLYRKPLGKLTVADTLRRYKTGGLRRLSERTPFLDVIASGVAPDSEREIAPHPSIKPQRFLRHLIRGLLPLGRGTVLDPFAGSGSTLAACENLRVSGVGIELDAKYFQLAQGAIPGLSRVTAPAVHRIQQFLPL